MTENNVTYIVNYDIIKQYVLHSDPDRRGNM